MRAERVLETEFGTRHKVDVANVIPPQSAAALAIDAGLADDTGWVPVDTRTFESRAAPGIHVIGDANIPGPCRNRAMSRTPRPSRRWPARSRCIAAQAPPEAVYFNTCYSHVGRGLRHLGRRHLPPQCGRHGDRRKCPIPAASPRAATCRSSAGWKRATPMPGTTASRGPCSADGGATQGPAAADPMPGVATFRPAPLPVRTRIRRAKAARVTVAEAWMRPAQT